MLTGELLDKYARLVLKIGVNLQKGQGLEIACPVEKREVAHAIGKAAYDLGASMVRVRWNDEIMDRLNYERADSAVLSDIPKWFVDSKNYLVEKNYCYIAVAAEDPSAFSGIPAEKIAAVAKAKSKALKKFSDCVMANGIRWCVVSVPTLAWAKQVFPEASDPEAALSAAIEKTMRLDLADPAREWENHLQRLEKRAKFLNENNFEYIHFQNGSGTDIKVGLAEDHLWIAARETAKDGVPFVANMPTEEVFTAPHRLKTYGTLRSARPLAENGTVIDDFSITFDGGKIVDFSAKKGYETLKHIIETDAGTRRLGEIALIGKTSPVAQCNALFFNTLFDENASCHLAIGKAYPTTVKGGDKMTAAELKQKGLNDSVEHVDFMIGTSDVCVTGIKYDGTRVPLFRDGDWII